MSEPIVLPSARDVRGSLDTPDGEREEGTRACVVACPPHPQFGGSRSDQRLTAVADALTERGIACLRFDYGPWDEGAGELQDTQRCVDWARERYDAVGLVGYSFGGCLALVAAAEDDDLGAVSALAPALQIDEEIGSVAAIEAITCPGQVVYGERDETVEWQPVVERAEARGFAVTELAADHHFVGQADSVADAVAPFLIDALG